MFDAMLQLTDHGLYCPSGDFHVDPWRPVPRAVVTHAHADHATPGCGRYLAAAPGLAVLRARMGPAAVIDTLPYGVPLDINTVRLSLHPAGHIIGSAQVRIAHRGAVAVVSGDYKTDPDPTCAPFEPVPCHLFLTESTFGLPIFRWPDPPAVLDGINAWWRDCRDLGRTAILYSYSLGKAQRLLAGLDPTIGPILTHGAVESMTQACRAAGLELPPTTPAATLPRGPVLPGALVLAPPSAHGSTWARRFAPASTAFASGWMRLRGTRRRRAIDRGFVLSDHADWPSLLAAIAATRAEHVWITHGYSEVLARWLADQALDARSIPTRFEGETDTGVSAAEDPNDSTSTDATTGLTARPASVLGPPPSPH
jgi:putative mRNA 3-end processing factor